MSDKQTTFILPTKKTPPSRKNPRILTLYGAPKVGKTTILSQLEGNCIFDTEQGTEYIESLKININSLADFNRAGAEVIKAGRPYKYISLDVVDTFEEWCEWYATETYMKATVGKSFNRWDADDFIENKAHRPGMEKPRGQWESVLTLARGGGYLWLREAFKKYLNRFESLAENIIIIGHLRDSVTVKDDIEVRTSDLNLTGKVKDILASRSSAIGYLYRTVEDKLMVSFKTTELVKCGSRVGHLKGQEFEFDWKRIYID